MYLCLASVSVVWNPLKRPHDTSGAQILNSLVRFGSMPSVFSSIRHSTQGQAFIMLMYMDKGLGPRVATRRLSITVSLSCDPFTEPHKPQLLASSPPSIQKRMHVPYGHQNTCRCQQPSLRSTLCVPVLGLVQDGSP